MLRDNNSELLSYLLDNRYTTYCLRANQALEGQYLDLQGDFYMNSNVKCRGVILKRMKLIGNSLDGIKRYEFPKRKT